MKFLYLLLFLVLIPYMIAALSESSQIYPRTLTTIRRCTQFAKSKFDTGRVDAYHNPERGELFLDEALTYSIRNCILKFGSNESLEMYALIYRLPINWHHDPRTFKSMADLREWAADLNVEVVLQILAFQGPFADLNQLPRGLIENKVQGSILFAAAEREMPNAFYNQAFFDNLCIAKNYDRAANKYLRLNGWHVKNMINVPNMKVCDIFGAIIIYVERKFAHLISKREALRKMEGILIDVILDMPYSPENLNGSVRLRHSIAVIIVAFSSVIQDSLFQ